MRRIISGIVGYFIKDVVHTSEEKLGAYVLDNDEGIFTEKISPFLFYHF